MKRYIATFWRANPQLKNGGYKTTRGIEAKTIKLAEKKAQEYTNCVYGSMSLLAIEESK